MSLDNRGMFDPNYEPPRESSWLGCLLMSLASLGAMVISLVLWCIFIRVMLSLSHYIL